MLGEQCAHRAADVRSGTGDQNPFLLEKSHPTPCRATIHAETWLVTNAPPLKRKMTAPVALPRPAPAQRPRIIRSMPAGNRARNWSSAKPERRR
jgi:hypothetical protein